MIDPERRRLDRFRRRLVELIPCDPEDARADLQVMKPRELLRWYVNWADRYIAPRPRRVLTWNGFLQHGSAQPHLEAVRYLAERIEAGEDLTPFLSRDIDRFGYVGPKPRSVQWEPVKDYALNAYETHHLHLTAKIRANGWSKRSRTLLYVSFSRDSAFFVMVGDHKSFDDGTLARAIGEARVGTADEFKGILGPGRQCTMLDQDRLQRRGFSTAFQVGDHTVIGAQLSSDGTAPLQAMHADRMIDYMIRVDPQLDVPGFGREWFEQKGWCYPATPAFEWTMQYCDLCLVETTTSTGFTLVKWRR
jgi:hypothetical protein